MIEITILTKELILNELAGMTCYACTLKLSDGQQTFGLAATAPGDTKDLPAYFQAQADSLWAVAQQKGHTEAADVVPAAAMREAISEACLDEINVLRTRLGLATVTEAEWKQKVLSKLSTLSTG